MKPYYQDEWVTQYHSDALTVLRGLESDSIDLLCTDPPYGIGFMGKDWDKALPDKRIWAECLRVLKPGAFGFVMSIPRSDCLSRMIIAVENAGFAVNFTPIYWAYASGFPKAQNIGKAVDKKARRDYVQAAIELGIKPISGASWRDWTIGEHAPSNKYWEEFKRVIPQEDWERIEREVTGEGKSHVSGEGQDNSWDSGYKLDYDRKDLPATPQAKALDGSYGGFQPKPAVEVIIVCMKPLSEKTFVSQALKNRKGITWLDDCRIPYESEGDTREGTGRKALYGMSNWTGDRQGFTSNQSGRFPANLLVSDDVLNDGRVKHTHSTGSGHKYPRGQSNVYGDYSTRKQVLEYNGDSGSFSRYFDLDKWAQKTFPFLIVPKASKSEKNKGLDYEPLPIVGRDEGQDIRNVPYKARVTPRINQHPTVKPLKLMSYLITLGSRPGDTVLDPFGGSGTTALASKLLGRKCIISETEGKYCEIAAERCSQSVMRLEI